MSTNIAFVTYETEYAPSGGIAAVVSYLPKAIQQASGLRTIVLTPYHWRIQRTVGLHPEPYARAQIPFLGTDLPVSIMRHVDQRGIEWFFLRPEDEVLFTIAEERFFAGFPHPYRTPEPVLVRDAILFGACVASALPAIDPLAQWTVLAQDWEGATAALALGDQGSSNHRVFLTLHNSYDSGGVDPQALRDVGIAPDSCQPINPSEAPSVLERALACVSSAVFTVSGQFAHELTRDVLQSEVMAPHLKDALQERLIGVDNGPFVQLALDPVALERARNRNFGGIAYWKQQRRDAFIDAIALHTPTETRPVWGDLAAFSRESAHGPTWFVFAGRDDPRQRGHDVAALAIDRFLEAGGQAQFLILPIPGDEGLRGLGFLKSLADEWPANVLALPFLFREGYFAALEGSAYGVMPSLYEPFGGANEFYLHGTVGIARATGGLIEQIVPLRAAACYSSAVHQRAARWHGLSGRPTGLLYREPDAVGVACHWHSLNRGDYDASGQMPGKNRVEHRSRNPLFLAMATELRLALDEGVSLWTSSQQMYFEMLVEGVDYIHRTFSWRRAAQEYVRVCRTEN
jgi:glycogen synthase